MNIIKQKTKTIKLGFENTIYKWLYKRKFGELPPFKQFLLDENNFSGRQLNIIYLSAFDSTFTINNTYLPLQELGKVFHFGMNGFSGTKAWYSKKGEINEKMVAFVKNTILEAESAGMQIDIIVCYLSGRTLTRKTLDFFQTLNMPIINEGLDDERKFINRKGPDGLYRGNKDVCKFFDLSLTTSKSALIKYIVEGAKVMYKPYAANPQVYKKLGLTKKYDVVFIGQKYGTRPEYINHLRKNGISVLTKGEGWDDGEASGEEMIELFNEAKIILGFAGVGINDDIMILKGRDFEAPLTGSFYITQRHDELKEYFNIGEDLETFLGKDELLRKVRYYLDNEDERERIAKNGFEKCLKCYTAKASYEKIFGYLDL